MIGVFLVELHVVKVDATNKIVSLLFLAVKLVCTALGKLSPQADITSIVFTYHTRNTVNDVGNIKACAVPAAENISIVDQFDEHLQELFFAIHKEHVVKLRYNAFCLVLAHVSRLDYKTNRLVQPVEVDAYSRYHIKWIVRRSKAQVFVEVDLNVKKCNIQAGRLGVHIVISKTTENNIHVAFKQPLVIHCLLFFLEGSTTCGLETFQTIAKNTCIFSFGIWVVEHITSRILCMHTIALLVTLNYKDCIAFAIVKCVD